MQIVGNLLQIHCSESTMAMKAFIPPPFDGKNMLNMTVNRNLLPWFCFSLGDAPRCIWFHLISTAFRLVKPCKESSVTNRGPLGNKDFGLQYLARAAGGALSIGSPAFLRSCARLRSLVVEKSTYKYKNDNFQDKRRHEEVMHVPAVSHSEPHPPPRGSAAATAADL